MTVGSPGPPRPGDRPRARARTTALVVGLFGDGATAQAAVNALVRAGVPPDRISTVARDEVMEETMPAGGAGIALAEAALGQAGAERTLAGATGSGRGPL